VPLLESAYSVFGLHLRANRSIPGLEPARTACGSSAIQVYFGLAPSLESEASAAPETLIFVSSILLGSGEPAFRVRKIANGAFLRLDYFDGMRFWMDSPGRTVWALWPDSLSLEDAASYLLGPVLGLLLRLRGVTCLHASAVSFGDYAVAFVGEQGAGKSTIAAAFARRGHAVLADDIVALVERDGLLRVMPAYPYLSLWPDSVEMLYGSAKALPSFSANFEKRMLPLTGSALRFEKESLPLAAIFLLGERSADATAPLLETLTPQQSLLSLVANSYATSLLDDDMRIREFSLFGRLLSLVPVRRLRPHQDPARIDRLCGRVEEACGRLPNRPLAAPSPA
jgi:hypothetical protein